MIIALVGQFGYHSRITQSKEYLPVCLAVVSARGDCSSLRSLLPAYLSVGTDHEILVLLKSMLEACKSPTVTQTGKLTFAPKAESA